MVKDILESITGQRQGAAFGAPFVYVQATSPGNQPGILKKGDLWIDNATDKLSYWDGTKWKAMR